MFKRSTPGCETLDAPSLARAGSESLCRVCGQKDPQEVPVRLVKLPSDDELQLSGIATPTHLGAGSRGRPATTAEAGRQAQSLMAARPRRAGPVAEACRASTNCPRAAMTSRPTHTHGLHIHTPTTTYGL
jgi:hypothetical protein